MRVVFDLDGTICLTDHRDHLVRQPEKNWDAFYAACVDDTPNWPVIEVLRTHLLSRHKIEIWTGRSEAVRSETVSWMISRGLYPGLLRHMRPIGDHSPDIELKRMWLGLARDEGRTPDLVYEDRSRVVAMWRASGIPCFQVAPGDF